MKVLEMNTSAFWKGETGVKGVVEDENSSYKVSLYIKGSQVRDYSCSCILGNSYKGMCDHARCLLEKYFKQQKETSAKPISTSQEVRTMIREYTNREVAQIILDGEEEKVTLEPRLLVHGQELSAEFKIGRGKFYVLKDLVSFVHAVETGGNVEYGKNLSFHHSPSCFTPKSRPLAQLVVELVNIYREHFEQFQKSSYASVPVLRELSLGKANRDRFFELMLDSVIECEDRKGIQRKLKVTDRMPEISVKIRKAGKDGIRVSVDKNMFVFRGEQYLYLMTSQHIYRLSPEAGEVLGVFLEQMTQGWTDHHEVMVQERDLPLFYERVLQKISTYCTLDVKEVELEEFRPQELKVKFEFDSHDRNELILIPTLSYGDYSFHPVEDENLPRSVCRDVPGEFRISQVITKYFKYREKESENPVIRDDEEALYRLLTEGMDEFMALGEVYISESASSLKLLPSPQVNIGVRTEGSWLELDVDAGELGGAQLEQVLAAYAQKKSYYRLKHGEFLKLDDNGLMVVSRLVESMAVSKKELMSGKLKLPSYRALYLDSMLKDGRGISLHRDNLYKALVRGMKSIEDSEYEIPESLKDVMRGYQKTGFGWLKTLDHYGFGGILADDMGLGKTLQVISVLLDESERHPDERMVSLIVCPASLVYNWENEFHRFAPTLQVTTVTGSASAREELLGAAGESDVVITSYDLLKRDIELYEPRKFRFQIIDEAQYIKNTNTLSARAVKAIQARTRFALTGTPIENRLGELWSIFDFLMPGILFGYQKFRKDYEIPIVKDQDAESLQMLRRMTGPFILRRLKSDVLKELPDKLETVVYSKLEEEQRMLYAAQALKLREQLEHADAAAYHSERMQFLAELMHLRQICCDPSLHYENYKGGSAKLSTCMELIRTGMEGGHKILLFSQFTSMLSIIEQELKKEGIACHMLTGATSKEERVRMVSAFHRDDVPVFLISLKAGGTGLNLTAADIVIHFDPWWNEAAQNQATDRAHRIGQEKQVSVFKLIAKDTIEENIMKLQMAKRSLADQVITDGFVSLSSLSKEDFIELLKEE